MRDEIAKIAGFWLELGVDGFRVDAVPFLIETSEIAGDVDLDPHEILRDLRSFISRRRGDGLLLGEVNLPPKQLIDFFGGKDARRGPPAVQLPGDAGDSSSRSRGRTREPLARGARARRSRSPRSASTRTSSATTTS